MEKIVLKYSFIFIARQKSILNLLKNRRRIHINNIFTYVHMYK